MPAGSKKSIYNPCPVCGLPRGKGPHEFAHGKCIEQRAATEGKESAGKPGKLSRITKDQASKGRQRANAKRYLTGNLPDWMYR